MGSLKKKNRKKIIMAFLFCFVFSFFFVNAAADSTQVTLSSSNPMRATVTCSASSGTGFLAFVAAPDLRYSSGKIAGASSGNTNYHVFTVDFPSSGTYVVACGQVNFGATTTARAFSVRTITVGSGTAPSTQFTSLWLNVYADGYKTSNAQVEIYRGGTQIHSYLIVPSVIDGLDPGVVYEVVVRKQGYKIHTAYISLRAGEDNRLDISLERQETTTTPELVSFRLKVVDEYWANYASSDNVRITVTNADTGQSVMSNVLFQPASDGWHRISVEKGVYLKYVFEIPGTGARQERYWTTLLDEQRTVQLPRP